MLDKFKEISEYYAEQTPYIIKRENRWAYPYGFDFDIVKEMSPIERDLWMDIRCYGKLPMYPQYPALGYFLDFGNPRHKIGIECDGKEFHNPEKDRKRDLRLFEEGWKIYRLPGSDCVKPIPDEYFNIHEYDDREKTDILRSFYENTGAGLVKALACYYLNCRDFDFELREAEMIIDCLNSRISLKDKFQHSIERIISDIPYDY